MLGKIAGPLYGAFLFYGYGRNGFVYGMLAVNLVAAGCAEITMPPSETSSSDEQSTSNRSSDEAAIAAEAAVDESVPLVSATAVIAEEAVVVSEHPA